MRLVVFCLARPTFDVELAAETARAAITSLKQTGAEIHGDATLLMDAAVLDERLSALAGQRVDGVLIVQASFCDAGMVSTIGKALSAPIAIWAFPEPRDGGRLRLNSFCGLNLGAHALGKSGRRCGWLHAPATTRPDLDNLFSQQEPAVAVRAARPGQAPPIACRVGLVGEHPAGFDTCAFDEAELKSRFGVDVERIALASLFAAAEAADGQRISQLRTKAATRLAGLADLDSKPVERSVRCYAALQDVADAHGLDGFAVRCWPETFTDYGCAMCGAMATLNEERIPASCEADMLGTVGSHLLQLLADGPTMLTDIVDFDMRDDTAVLWHCGLAPIDFCDPEFAPRATNHTNRGMPLLHEFPLKPGRITVARISQARSELKMVVGRGEMLRRAMSFTGTSGVIRFDCGAEAARRTLLDAQLEHHLSIVYGDVKQGVEAAAAAVGLPVLDLDETR